MCTFIYCKYHVYIVCFMVKIMFKLYIIRPIICMYVKWSFGEMLLVIITASVRAIMVLDTQYFTNCDVAKRTDITEDIVVANILHRASDPQCCEYDFRKKRKNIYFRILFTRITIIKDNDGIILFVQLKSTFDHFHD